MQHLTFEHSQHLFLREIDSVLICENLFQVSMAGHILSVCIFCLLCATHTPCASHAAVSPEHLEIYKTADLNNQPIVESRELEIATALKKRDIDKFDKDVYLKKLFVKYGDGESIGVEGLEKLLDRVFELQMLSKSFDLSAEAHSLEDGHQDNQNKTVNTFYLF